MGNTESNQIVTVIDAPCGSGKSSLARQIISQNPDQAFIYCTPFLDEIDSFISSCQNHDFKQPEQKQTTKIEDFNKLLEQQADIAVTHSTFLNSTRDTLSLIQQGNYILFIDEALDVIQQFNDLQQVKKEPEQKVNEDDIQALLDGGNITIGKNGVVQWVKGHYPNGKNRLVEHFARLNRLYWVNGKMMICIFPPEMFDTFKKVYCMTYLFNGNSISPYFKIMEIPYEIKSVERVIQDDGTQLYQLCPHTKESDVWFRKKCKKNIHIWDNKLANDYKRMMLTKSGYEKMRQKDYDGLKNHLNNYFRNVLKVKATDFVYAEDLEKPQTPIMWTAFSDFYEKIKGKGYTTAKRLTKQDKANMTEDEYKDLSKHMDCFVPCNIKASNDYRPRWALAYLVNLFYNTMMMGFFTSYGVKFDNDAYAIANMLQWICRSRIRDGGEIWVYIPSERMRKLYQRWLDGEFSM